MDRYNKIPVGVEYPIGNRKMGYFDTTFDSNSNALSCLRLFFSTMKGERRMNPEYGTSLWNYIFENKIETTENVIRDIVTREISIFFPEIILKNVSFKQNIKFQDTYLIEIEIKFYSSKASTEMETLRFSSEI